MAILIAEDDQDIRALLKLQLEKEGYACVAVKDGMAALDALQDEAFDLALLDVMMPRLDGFNLLRRIRETGNMLPVIFLTARGDDMDKILGLGIGADDYLVKPFSMAELVARVGAAIRRSQQYTLPKPATAERTVCGALALDTAGCCAYVNGEPVDLSAKEYLLLKLFMENPGRVFTKKQLYGAVWGEDIYYDDNTVMVHISHIRNKIEQDSKTSGYIKTIRGIGYKLEPFGRQP